MANDKSKSTVRTTVRDDIKSNLIKELKVLTGKFGEASEKLEKAINKGAKKLAKKISKKITIAEPPATEEVKEVKAKKAEVKAVKAPAKPAKATTKTAAAKKKV